MAAIDEHSSPLSNAAADADQPGDELENWLSDLRSEVAADPPGWIDRSSGSEHPAGRAGELDPLSADQPGPGDAEPTKAGRHRAAD